jgi:hypothetical protein
VKNSFPYETPELVEFKTLAGKVTLPPQVISLIMGYDAGDSDTSAENRQILAFLRILQQGLENPELLKDKAIKEIFNAGKLLICDAVQQKIPYLLRHAADALEAAAKHKHLSRIQAIAFAFVNLRSKYENGKVPRAELEQEARREWAESVLLYERRISIAPGYLQKHAQLIEDKMADFPESSWSRDFKDLGITPPLLEGRTQGRPRKN